MDKDFEQKIKNVEEALKKALKENNLELVTKIDFPKYRELPISVQLALVLLEQEGATIVRQYKPIEEVKKNVIDKVKTPEVKIDPTKQSPK